MSPVLVVLGASSSIARIAAGAFAARGYRIYLAGRDSEDLDRIAADLEIRHGAPVWTGAFDAEAFASHEGFVEEVLRRAGRIDGVLLAFGYLGDQEAAARDFRVAERVIRANFTGAVSILTHLAPRLQAQRSGFIIGLSSVAGDRGRRRNYPYGAAKGALSLYLQGLRGRLFQSGVRVITVKLGFVDTAMTFDLPGLFRVASPERVGEAIARAPGRSRDVIYVPWFWRWVLFIVRMIPESLYKRLDF